MECHGEKNIITVFTVLIIKARLSSDKSYTYCAQFLLFHLDLLCVIDTESDKYINKGIIRDIFTIG